MNKTTQSIQKAKYVSNKTNIVYDRWDATNSDVVAVPCEECTYGSMRYQILK